MLALESVTKYYGAQLVLQDVSVGIGGHTRLGVVGPNGIGKSTLLRIGAGLESPDAGKVVRDARARVGYLPQEVPSSHRSLAVRDFIKQRTCLAKVEHELQGLLAALDAQGDEARILELSTRHAGVLDRIEFRAPQRAIVFRRMSRVM